MLFLVVYRSYVNTAMIQSYFMRCDNTPITEENTLSVLLFPGRQGGGGQGKGR